MTPSRETTLSRLGPIILVGLAALAVVLAAVRWVQPRGWRSEALRREAAAPVARDAAGNGSLDTAVDAHRKPDRSLRRDGIGVAGERTYTPGKTSWRGSGVVRLQAIDAFSRQPVPGLDFIVMREAPGWKLLGGGTTNEHGRARLTDLPAGVLIIESQRRPPLAPTQLALVLDDDAETDATLVVIHGGSLAGRVVDDAGGPVAGALIRFKVRERSWERMTGVLARTGADGGYQIEALANRATTYRLVDGVPRRMGARDTIVQARFGERKGTVTCRLTHGQLTRIPDIVLPRGRVFSGTVRDHVGRLLEGVLVSASPRRQIGVRDGVSGIDYRLGPVDPDFRLGPQECLTGSGGGFELASVRQPRALSVWTRDGARQSFPCPPVGRGQRRDDIELVLSEYTVLFVELVAPDDKRLTGIAVSGVLADGTRVDGSVRRPDRSPSVICQLDGPASAIDTLELRVEGFETLRDPVNGSLVSGQSRGYTLIPLPVIHLRIDMPAPDSVLVTVPRLTLDLRACLIPPAIQRPRRCCGLGGSRFETLAVPESEERITVDTEIPVRTHRAYWIRVRIGLFSGVYGPYPPGEPLHQIVLGPEIWQPLRRMLARRKEKASRKSPEPPAEAVKKKAPPRYGTIALEVVDAETGDPLRRARLRCEGRRYENLSMNSSGRLRKGKLVAGAWRARLRCPGYRSPEPFEFTLQPEEHLDLGRIAMQPLPIFIVRLLRPDGSPYPTEAPLTCAFEVEDGKGGRESLTSVVTQRLPDGSLRLKGDLPASFFLIVRTGERRRQVLRVDRWPAGTEAVLHLRACRQGLILAGGLAPDLAGLGLHVWLEDVRDDSGIDVEALDPLPDGTRRYRFAVTPGSYVVGIKNPLTGGTQKIPITVEDLEAEQVFEVTIE